MYVQSVYFSLFANRQLTTKIDVEITDFNLLKMNQFLGSVYLHKFLGHRKASE